jgi:uncharacterized protein DUF6220
MTRWARWINVGAAWLFAAAVVLQGYLAGQALAQLGGNGDFSMHRDVGYTVLGILALVIIVTALVGRMPRRHVGWSAALVILYVVQTSLPFLRTDSPAIAALHPANAMVLLVVAIFVGWRGRAIVKADPVA